MGADLYHLIHPPPQADVDDVLSIVFFRRINMAPDANRKLIVQPLFALCSFSAQQEIPRAVPNASVGDNLLEGWISLRTGAIQKGSVASNNSRQLRDAIADQAPGR